MTDTIIIGAGYAGSVCARMLADKGEQIVLYDKRPHIAGNMYEETDKQGVRYHKYGPHISVMRDERVFNFLSRFTDWIPYEHRVNAEIDGMEVPLPFNFTSILRLFPKDRAYRLIELLTDEFGENTNIPILELRKSTNPETRELAEYIYEKVFLHYTVKMWGTTPEEIDPAVTGRVPVRLSFDNRHFLHPFQVMPKDGFNRLFENMLNHKNIDVRLNTPASDVLHIDMEKGIITVDGKVFDGKVIYTGALDELFSYCYGVLPYRTLRFDFASVDDDRVQDTAVLNYPDDRPFTRRTDMKLLTGQVLHGHTVTLHEYPGVYIKDDPMWGEPMYPIVRDDCHSMYEKYRKQADSIANLYLTGRLASYRYYNMEDTIKEAMSLAESISK